MIFKEIAGSFRGWFAINSVRQAGIAQLVEHPTCNRTVVGSIPTASKVSLAGVSHSGQLHQTVNLTTSVYVGSTPTTPTLSLLLLHHIQKPIV